MREPKLQPQAAAVAAPVLERPRWHMGGGTRSRFGGGRVSGSHRAARRAATPSSARVYLRLCRNVDLVAGPLLLLLSFVLSNFPASADGLQEFLGMRVTVKNLLYLVAFALIWRGICTVWGLYNWSAVRRRSSELLRLAGVCATGGAGAMVFAVLSVTGAFDVATVVAFWLGSMAVLGLTRAFLRSFVLWNDRVAQEVVIVGTGPRARSLYEQITSQPEGGTKVVGFVDDEVWSPAGFPQDLHLGRLDMFEEYLMRSAVDEVLIALPVRSRYTEVQETLKICERVGVRAKYMADVFEHAQAEARFEGNHAVPGVAMVMAPEDHRLIIKRVMDLAGAVAGLILLGPVMLLAAGAVKVTSPGPVLFKQPRYGLNRRRFDMLKFRTMVEGAEAMQADLEHLNETGGPTFKIKEDPRITAVGRWLRRTSIDELPQLLHVLTGEMSLVGPRPLPERDVHRFTDSRSMRRFSVRPGLTCLWQIRGRSEVGFDDWIALDLKFIDEWSLGLELKILLQTIPVVLRGRGAV